MTDSNPSPPDLPTAVDRVARAVVGVISRRGTSSAVAWRAGLLVGSAAAVGQASRVQLVFDGEPVEGDIKGVDASTDVALIAADLPSTPPERRLVPELRVGDFVFAAGRDSGGAVHASFGHVGKVGEAWRTWRGGQIDRLVRLDGGLYPGLMGAALADARGQFLGLASAALTRHHAVVIPTATIDRVGDALLAHGRVRRGHLGIAVQAVALPASARAAADGAGSGLLVTGVGEASPAADAGITVGDILLTAGGAALDSFETLRDLLHAGQIGARLRLTLLRGGRREEVAVEVADQEPRRDCC